MFSNDSRSPDQRQRDNDQAEAIGRFLIAAVFLVVLPYVTLSALIGYLMLTAYHDKKAIGTATVLFILVAAIFYLVGLPGPFLLTAERIPIALWPGALFTDFGDAFVSGYKALYSFFHWTIAERTYFKFIELTRLVTWALIPGGLIAWGIFHGQKRWIVRPGLYRLFKNPLDFWLTFVADPVTTLGSKLIFLGFQSGMLWMLGQIILPRLPGAYWTVHLGGFLLFVGTVLGLVGAIVSELHAPKDRADEIPIADDGTTFSPQILNHHVHVLGETGFGKSVFLMRLIEHHVRHGMGLIFIDLKADTDTVSHIAALCERHGRLNELMLFDCSRPELSIPYNVLVRGNPTEIKDKLVGSFSWENSYYKDAAQSFLLTVIRALVWLRDNHSISFTLEDVYQSTLSPDTLVALQTELNTKSAPESLREDINHLAHYLRGRENFKELHGLRTQIKLLIDSEFGPLLTSTEPGIDLFDCIQSHKIVYVLLDSQRYGESAKQLGKLILQDLKSASSKIIEEIPKEERVPCAIIIDEFADLATEQFVGFLNRARGSKLGIVVAHQEMSDLEVLSPTMRDQIMGNTATTVSFLQKMPESAERLAAIAGTKRTKKATRQLQEDGFLIKSRQYTGMESEREVEEFIIHPNVFKNLRVGECVIIGKYPSAWNKKVRIPPPEQISVNADAVRDILKRLRTTGIKGDGNRPLGLKGLVKAQYAKAAARVEKQEPLVSAPTSAPDSTANSKIPSPGSDPNF